MRRSVRLGRSDGIKARCMVTTESSEAMASAETVVIIGKPGVGKSTIGNQILGRDAFQIGVEYERRRATSPKGDLEVFLVNTFSPPKGQPHGPEMSKMMQFGLSTGRTRGALKSEEYYRYQIPQIGSLMIFVYRQERFTEDARTQLEAAIGVLDENAREISALVITCCEGKTQEAKESIVKDFTTNPLTKDIAKFMKKGIYCVGFPDEMNVEPQLRKHYTKDIERSQETLKHLLKQALDNEPRLLITKSLVSETESSSKALTDTDILEFEIEKRHPSRRCNCSVL